MYIYNAKREWNIFSRSFQTRWLRLFSLFKRALFHHLKYWLLDTRWTILSRGKDLLIESIVRNFRIMNNVTIVSIFIVNFPWAHTSMSTLLPTLFIPGRLPRNRPRVAFNLNRRFPYSQTPNPEDQLIWPNNTKPWLLTPVCFYDSLID